MVSRCTSLYLRISEAKNLLAKDLNGKSDPYCMVKVNNQIVARTATVYKSLEPLWTEEFKLHLPHGFQDLSITIFDEDKVSGDDRLGTVSITKEMLQELGTASGFESWFPLMKADKDWEIQGELLLEYGIWTSEATTDSHISISILEGRDLAPKDKTGYSDPYVTVTCLDQTKTTSSQKKTRFPEWNETFEFVVPASAGEHVVTVTVWDHDRLRSDDFMGQVVLMPSDILETKVKKWHPVARRRASLCLPPALTQRRGSKVDRGKLRVRVQLLEEVVLPSSCYQPMAALLVFAVQPENGALGKLLFEKLESSRTLDQGEIAGTLIRFYLSQDCVLQYLSCITDLEVEETDNPNTLFRGNSLATKSMDQLMKIVGMPYLHQTLSPAIERVFGEKRTVELDPHRVNSVRRRHSLHWESEENFLQTSQETLAEYLQDVMGRILNSAQDCHPLMRLAFKNLQAVVRRRWPEEVYENTQYLAVSGFLFLRFFAPAILSPKLFYLQDHHPNRKVSRTLTLLAKMTQNIGNLTEQVGKETWMEPLAPIVHSYIDQVKTYIDQLVTIHDSQGCSYSPQGPLRQQSSEVILRQGFLNKCRYNNKRLFRPLVLKKRFFWLTLNALHYATSQEETMSPITEKTHVSIPLDQICAVERVDYAALNKTNMAQVLYYNEEDSNPAILYFQAKDVNELTLWISAIRKTIKTNPCRVAAFHPGVYKGDKWNCCHKAEAAAPGCGQTYHGVVVEDWQDPLEPDLRTQVIFSQLRNSKDSLKRQQLEQQVLLTKQGGGGEAETGSGGPSQRLADITQVVDVIEQLTMSHEAYQGVGESA